MLVDQLKKQTIAQKSVSLKKEITDQDHDKYITTSEYNTLATNVVNTKIMQANLITKIDFNIKVWGIDLTQKMVLKSILKALLNGNIEDYLMKVLNLLLLLIIVLLH